MNLTADYKRVWTLSPRRRAEKVTDYSAWTEDDYDQNEGSEEEHPYFGVGHGDYNEEQGFSPSYVVWAQIDGRIRVSKPIDPDSERDVTHGSLWGHNVTDRDYKGRYEPETGRLTIVKPERQRFRDIPDVLWTALRAKFKTIDEVRVF